ncbi:MAG: molybdopterin synthase catalytic subunit MoaE [Pseudomonadales bacterium]|nr:molybdopterin synthase catalytic subunit MoaE [Pseudomonadales bacterium]
MESNGLTDNNEVIVQEACFDSGQEVQRLQSQSSKIGAVVSFIGVMRDFNNGSDVESMTLEHYPAMTSKSLLAIVQKAKERWLLIGIKVIHRVGEFKPQDPIVFVAVTSEHRGDAFSACEFVMDYLKTQAPFWKKENLSSGSRWVDGRQSDREAAKRWDT